MADKKWDAYVINLDESTDRWKHMQTEFADTVFNLNRFSAVNDPQKRGWVGVGKSYGAIVKDYMEKDPNFEKLLVVFEDDAYRTQDKTTFNERCKKIMEYLEKHKGEYSHFQGGGIYPNLEKIECEDPLLIRCDWITCATFTVIGKEAAETIMKYQEVPDDKKDPIDNYLAANNRGKMLVPFPHLCWQLFGMPSTISNSDQKVTLNEGFRNAHTAMVKFLKDKNINITVYSGGSRKKKEISFVDYVMKKQKRKEKGLNYRRCKCAMKKTKKRQIHIFNDIKDLKDLKESSLNKSKKQPSSVKTHKSLKLSKVE